MLGMSILFFVLTLLSAVIGFGGVMPGLAFAGQISFAVCLLLFAVFMRREYRRQRIYSRKIMEPVSAVRE